MIEWQNVFGISSVALEIENTVYDRRKTDLPDRMSGPIVDMSDNGRIIKI